MNIKPGQTVKYRWHVGAAAYGNARVEERTGMVANVKKFDGVTFYQILGARGWVKADRIVEGSAR